MTRETVEHLHAHLTEIEDKLAREETKALERYQAICARLNSNAELLMKFLEMYGTNPKRSASDTGRKRHQDKI